MKKTKSRISDLASKDITEYTKLPKTKEAAQEQGAKKFFNGVRCANGHLAPRYTTNNRCVECRRKSNKRYSRDPELVRKWNTSERHKELAKQWRRNNPRRHWAATAAYSAKCRAKKRGIPYSLTVDYVESILPDECPVFKIKFEYGIGRGRSDLSPSLDRIRPELGYVEGNVVVISMRANQIKNRYMSRDVYKVAIWLKKLGL